MKLTQLLWKISLVTLAWLGVVFTVPATNYKLEVVAGNGTAGYSGDKGPAVSAQLNWPIRLTFHKGDLYIPELMNHVIRRVDLHSKKIFTVLGNGTPGFRDGRINEALFYRPIAVTFLLNTEIMYVADVLNYRLRQIFNPLVGSGKVSTIFGNGNAQYFHPKGLVTDGKSIYVAERENHRIQKIYQLGSVWRYKRIAGTGIAGIDSNSFPTQARLPPVQCLQ